MAGLTEALRLTSDFCHLFSVRLGPARRKSCCVGPTRPPPPFRTISPLFRRASQDKTINPSDIIRPRQQTFYHLTF